MLGRILENLLAEEINPETQESARKSKGAFYTPREIVDFMVISSLREYLNNKSILSKEDIDILVSNNLHEFDLKLSQNEKKSIIKSLNNIKVLDPACGSGAFPMSMLLSIISVLDRLDPDCEIWSQLYLKDLPVELLNKIDTKNINYERKLKFIRENIFGIDIHRFLS